MSVPRSVLRLSSAPRAFLKPPIRRVLSSSQSSSHGYQKENTHGAGQFRYAPYAGALAAAVIVAAEIDDQEGQKKSAKQSINQSDLKQIEYQNRIRRFSTPDKIFRLFATVKVTDKPPGSKKVEEIIYMTAEDFVRSITPGELQPQGLGLDEYDKVRLKDLEKYLKNAKRSSPSNAKAAIFNQLTENGLLTFSDYIFLLTVLSTSARHWKILFKVFDQNGDGEVDRYEFQKVMKLAQKNTTTGERHRDTGASTAKNVLKRNSAISNYFYPDANAKLTLDEFLKFHEELKSEILRIQFDKQGPNENDQISKLSFARILLEYMEHANTYNELERIRTIMDQPTKRAYGVTFSQVESLYRVLACIDDIEMALDMHTSAGIELSKETFKHVAYVVAKERIDDTTLEVMWSVFDVDQSGGLSNKEFLKIIKSRASFGLEKPKDTGLWRLFNAVYICGKEKVGLAQKFK